PLHPALHSFPTRRSSDLFAAPQHAEGFRRVGVFHADGDVGQQFFLQTIAEVARSQKSSLFAGKRTAVDGKNHRQRWLVNQQRLEDRKSTRLNSSHVSISY